MEKISHRPVTPKVMVWDQELWWKENDEYHRIDRAGNYFVNGKCQNKYCPDELSVSEYANYKRAEITNTLNESQFKLISHE